jgi:uncharacterized protein with PQ loop repeat
MKPLSNDPALISSFAIFGIAATQIMNLSSVSSIIEIIRAGCTLCYPSFPFSVSIVASSTGIVYSIASNQLLVGVSSWLSVGQSTIYLGVHFVYSRDRSAIVRQLLTHSIVIGGSIGAGPLFACSFASDCSSFVRDWFGIVMTIVSCVRYSAQSSTFLEVVRSRNSASISPLMTAGATFASLAWIFYSVPAGDVYYLVISVAGLISCCTQVFCLLRYPRFQVAQVCGHEGDTIELLSVGTLGHNIATLPPIEGEVQSQTPPPIDGDA